MTDLSDAQILRGIEHWQNEAQGRWETVPEPHRAVIHKAIKQILRHEVQFRSDWVSFCTLWKTLRFVSEKRFTYFEPGHLHAAIVAANARKPCISIWQELDAADQSVVVNYEYKQLILPGQVIPPPNPQAEQRQLAKRMVKFLRDDRKYDLTTLTAISDHLTQISGMNNNIKPLLLMMIHQDQGRFSAQVRPDKEVWVWAHSSKTIHRLEHPHVPLTWHEFQRAVAGIDPQSIYARNL